VKGDVRVIPGAFDYHCPATLDEAIALLQKVSGAKLLAGGQSLVPAMRFRLATPEALIDLNRIQGLSYLEERGDHLAIGALCREHALEDSALIARSYPMLLDTAKVIADPLVRNHATVGGNLAHADSSRARSRRARSSPRSASPSRPRAAAAPISRSSARSATTRWRR
jgi:carbon-monoxide dehydrogenase medium subunit